MVGNLEDLFNSRPSSDIDRYEDYEDYAYCLENYCDDLENGTEEMLDTLIEIIEQNVPNGKLVYHDEEIKDLVEYVYKKKHNFHKEYKEAMVVLEKQNKELKNELCQKCGKYQLEHEGACDGCKWHNREWYCVGNKSYYKLEKEEKENETK